MATQGPRAHTTSDLLKGCAIITAENETFIDNVLIATILTINTVMVYSNNNNNNHHHHHHQPLLLHYYYYSNHQMLEV